MLVESSDGRSLLVRSIVVGLSLAGAVACAGPPPAAGPWPVIPKATVTTIVVRNHHGADLRIWAVAPGGANHRLGLVPRLGVSTLVLPGAIRLPAQVQFAAIPMSSDDPQVTDPIESLRGD
jgi:hypothetical protein